MKKKILFSLVAFLIVCAAVEAISHAALYFLAAFKGIYVPGSISFRINDKFRKNIRRILEADPKKEYVTFDPELGWTLNPNAKAINAEGICIGETNSLGARNAREYPRKKPAGKLRIAAFGDSFTHGSQMPTAFTWQAILEEHDPRLEVLNFGVEGYGLDQAYLRYLKDGVGCSPDIVLICYMSENLARHVNVFRGFYTGTPYVKPRFLLDEKGELKLLPCPIRKRSDFKKLLDYSFLEEIGRNDFWSGLAHRPRPLERLAFFRLLRFFGGRKISGRPVTADERAAPLYVPTKNYMVYDTRSEAYRVTLKIIEKFYKEVESHGAVPVVVFLPDRQDIEAYLQWGERRYAPLLEELRKKEYSLTDSMGMLERATQEYGLYEVTQSHYKPNGNRALAIQIYKYLHDSGLV